MLFVPKCEDRLDRLKRRGLTGEGPGASLSLAAAGPCAIGRDPGMDAWQDVCRQRLAAFGV
jgi:hypothetical protein